MKIESPAFAANQPIPKQYTCDGDNKNPPLFFQDIPTETKSLALIVDDPDAPNGVFTHWIIFNLDPNITEIAEDSVPRSAGVGVNDFGITDYSGPCPPDGTHQYRFTLYALRDVLDVPTGASLATVTAAMHHLLITEAVLTGTYTKPA